LLLFIHWQNIFSQQCINKNRFASVKFFEYDDATFFRRYIGRDHHQFLQNAASAYKALSLSIIFGKRLLSNENSFCRFDYFIVLIIKWLVGRRAKKTPALITMNYKECRSH